MLIKEHGEKKAETIVRGWVDNLATGVQSNDSKVINAVDAGICDAGIVNTYYYGRILKKNNKLKAKLFWPNQKSGGVHANVSGGAVLKDSKKKKLLSSS